MNTLFSTITTRLEQVMHMGGFASSIILGITGIYLLRNRSPYLWAFIWGGFANQYVNKGLKLWIQQPRPSNPILFREMESEKNYENEERFGMPSGHAQSAFFIITYIYLVNKSTSWLIISSFLGCITLFQRWKYRRHTVAQLAVGTGIGIFMAYMLFTGMRTYLSKKDFTR